jgi:hypothetical protein
MFDEIPTVMIPVFIMLGACLIMSVLILAIWIDEWFDSRNDDDDGNL